MKKHTADERLELAILRQPEKKRLELLELARPQALREDVRRILVRRTPHQAYDRPIDQLSYLEGRVLEVRQL